MLPRLLAAELDEETVWPEDILIAADGAAGGLQVVAADGGGDFAEATAGERNHVVGALGDGGEVAAGGLAPLRAGGLGVRNRLEGGLLPGGLAEEAKVSGRGHAAEVGVAESGGGEEGEVVAALGGQLDAEDGLDAGLPRGLVETHRAVEAIVVGDREG